MMQRRAVSVGFAFMYDENDPITSARCREIRERFTQRIRDILATDEDVKNMIKGSRAMCLSLGCDNLTLDGKQHCEVHGGQSAEEEIERIRRQSRGDTNGKGGPGGPGGP